MDLEIGVWTCKSFLCTWRTCVWTVKTLYMDLDNLYMHLDNLYMDPKNPYTGCIWRGASPSAPPLAPPARVILVRGRAEYRQSPSGAREMCVPTGPAGEMCVPKPFSCLFVLFLVALHEKSKTGSAGNQQNEHAS